MREHILYETGDAGAPDSIKDGNGEVVLGLCKVCGAAEVQLEGRDGYCPGTERLVKLEKLSMLMAASPTAGYRVTIDDCKGVVREVGLSRRAVARMLKTDIDYEKNGRTFEGLE